MGNKISNKVDDVIDNKQIKYVGFWKGYDSKWTEMPIEDSATCNQTNIINKITKLQKIANETQYRGYSCCRLCDFEYNGSKEYAIGKFVWPEGYLHYIEVHNVAIDEEFAKYVDKKI